MISKNTDSTYTTKYNPSNTQLWHPGLVSLFSLHFSLTLSYTFTLINNCPHTIWPGTLAGSGSPKLSTTGFQLDSGQSVRLTTVPGWSGRICARTGCKFDVTGAGKCLTGDCGGKLECDGNGAAPPTSLFEITLDGANGQDFYDVSMVDGYNLPLLALPRGVSGGACNATGCVTDVNRGKSSKVHENKLYIKFS
nr:thaumatin-like protein 1 [Arachis hypogaea]